MALNANNIPGGNGGNRVAQDLLEIGNYPGRLVQIIDYGLQAQRPYQGQEKPPAYELGLTYELLDAFMKDEDGNELEDKPRWVSESMPLHNIKADKAKSTLRYNALDPQFGCGGDWSKLAGTPCVITIVHNPGKGANAGKVYENIGNVSPMRPKDAIKALELKNPPKVFDLDAPDMTVFAQFPKWIQEKIQSNLGYKGSKLEKLAGRAPAKQEEKPVKDVVGKADQNQNNEDFEADTPY